MVSDHEVIPLLVLNFYPQLFNFSVPQLIGTHPAGYQSNGMVS
jgi:hypothetical protein